MIINLTGEPIRVYGPDAPEVIEADALDLECTVFAAEVPPAFLDLVHLDLDEARTAFHGGRPVEIHLVQHIVRDLPAARRGVYLLVDSAVGLTVRGRADLLIGFDSVRDAAGAVVGYRHLVSPC
ncbi:hypothetical protein [Streptomyces erythrochromogenes]|uniref:hypothetical protein n=1 Tax=Streptomyces erythrochromogenes TaxID=285574 RepID=UPI0036C31F0A